MSFFDNPPSLLCKIFHGRFEKDENFIEDFIVIGGLFLIVGIVASYVESMWNTYQERRKNKNN